MNFLLKIVEGPNKGAEIALPEGVAVTLGKSDGCDIVLADSTLPDEPVEITAAPDGVTVAGERLEPFYVKTLGATAFAVGPADAPWDALKRQNEGERGTGNGERVTGNGEQGTGNGEPDNQESHADPEPPKAPEADEDGEKPAKKRGGCCGCILALLVFIVVIAVFGWIFRKQAKPYVDKARPYAERALSKFGISSAGGASSVDGETAAPAAPADPLEEFAERNGLVLTNRAGRVVVLGDFETRAERLSATARAYAVKPGIELDFCDAESMRTAAEETFSLVGEKELKVVAVTNRVLAVSGRSADIRRTLEAIASDIPKLRNVDCTAVEILQVPGPGGLPVAVAPAQNANEKTVLKRSAVQAPKPLEQQAFKLPVCGILTTPYPCLVLRNGARVLEGAPLGDSIVTKIEADSVTVTNSAGKFVWRP